MSRSTLGPMTGRIEIKSEDGGKLLIVEITGKLQKEDYRRFAPVVADAVALHGKVRMLVEMRDFHGWSAGALWEDVKFDWRHFNDIECLAIVGDKLWEHAMAVFCKPFTSAAIRYFPQDQQASARAWITEYQSGPEPQNAITRNFTLPELALIAGTRAALGLGAGLLLGEHMRPQSRKAIGWTLFAIGALTTIPLAAQVMLRGQSNSAMSRRVQARRAGEAVAC